MPYFRDSSGLIWSTFALNSTSTVITTYSTSTTAVPIGWASNGYFVGGGGGGGSAGFVSGDLPPSVGMGGGGGNFAPCPSEIHVGRATPYRPPSKITVLRGDVVKRRARRILLENLNENQRRTLEANNFFEVRGSRGNTYRILTDKGLNGNVKRVVSDIVTESLCAHIHERESCPADDHFLAQKVLLEVDEAAFRRIANISTR